MHRRSRSMSDLQINTQTDKVSEEMFSERRRRCAGSLINTFSTRLLDQASRECLTYQTRCMEVLRCADCILDTHHTYVCLILWASLQTKWPTTQAVAVLTATDKHHG